MLRKIIQQKDKDTVINYQQLYNELKEVHQKVRQQIAKLSYILGQ